MVPNTHSISKEWKKILNQCIRYSRLIKIENNQLDESLCKPTELENINLVRVECVSTLKLCQ